MTYWQEREEKERKEKEQRMLWLRSLQPGQEFVYGRHSVGAGRAYDIYEVVRVTATQIVAKSEYGSEVRFCRKEGHMKGQHRHWTYAEPLTKEIAEKIEFGQLRSWASIFNDRQTLDQLDLLALRELKRAVGRIVHEAQERRKPTAEQTA